MAAASMHASADRSATSTCSEALAIAGASAYIRPAMSFWRNISPSGAVRDFAQVWVDNPYRWRVLAVSIAATAVVMAVAIPESQRIPPEKPTVTYITTFEPGRTDEEIIASNIENQKLQDAIRAEEEKRAEFRKQLYRELGRATGLDVDAMEREIAKEKAAEERAAAEEAKRIEARRTASGLTAQASEAQDVARNR